MNNSKKGEEHNSAYGTEVTRVRLEAAEKHIERLETQFKRGENGSAD